MNHQYLDELCSDLRAKIEKFLEEHPAAVVIESKSIDPNQSPDGRSQLKSELCRFLDKDGKQSDYYLYYERRNWCREYCGCSYENEKICVSEKKDNEPEHKRRFIFSLLKRDDYNCPKDIMSGMHKSGAMCDVEIPDSYDAVSELIAKFKGAIKKQD